MDQPLIGFVGDCVLLGSGLDSFLHGILPILGAFVALGVVIFVHELGHFAVAKICGVKCEKFYLGFDIGGWKFCSFQWGETEYGIGILPLGGYVKMLGQDDNPTRAAEERERAKAKPAASAISPATSTATQVPVEHSAAVTHSGDLPHEPTAEDHEAFDPRSYMAKSVPQRMAIISAGVIMNLIFAVIFATVAYRWSVNFTPCVVGEATPGDPAWTQGIRPGDRIVQFGNDKPSQYLRFDNDLLMGVLFTGANNDLHLVIDRPSQNPESGKSKTIDLTVRPTDAHKAAQDGRAVIGVRPAESNQLAIVKDSAYPSPAVPGSPAANATPALEWSDRIVGADVDGAKHVLQNGVQIEALLAQHPDQSITFSLLRSVEGNPAAEPKKVESTIAPAPLRDLGFVMQMGPIVAVQKGSPADKAGLRSGDRIKSIDGHPIDDPIRLPNDMAKLAGKEIAMEVSRADDAGKEKTVALRITPRLPLIYDRAPASSAFGCDALGIAYPVLNTVGSVRADASTEAKELQSGDKLVSAEFSPTPEQKKKFEAEGIKFPTKATEFDDEHLLWPEFQAVVQSCPTEVPIKLTFKRGDKDISAKVRPIEVAGAFYPGRGLLLETLSENHKADSMSEAFSLGLRETKESILQIVMTVRKLASGGVSPTGMAGPGTIVAVAAASASQGIPKLLIFLTFLSANLAVINFLPIPILDGGHMMFLLYEGIRGKPASERVQMYLTYLGLVFILTLMVFVIGLDLTRFVKWIWS